MNFTKLLWDRLVKAATDNPQSECSGLVQALDRALEEDREQPLEVTFRLLKAKGPTIRVSVEDLGKLIHDYNNALVVREALEHEVGELMERLERSAECAPECKAGPSNTAVG